MNKICKQMKDYVGYSDSADQSKAKTIANKMVTILQEENATCADAIYAVEEVIHTIDKIQKSAKF